MTPFSILDLSPITEGSDAGTSFRNSLDLAQHAERLGYRRFWLAEHHGMPGIASAATAVLIAHVGAATSRSDRRRWDHAAESLPAGDCRQFGTLDRSFRGGRSRIGPRARHRRDRCARVPAELSCEADAFPQDVVELWLFLAPRSPASGPAVPGEGQDVEVWILGSSLFGAQLAAALASPTRSPRISPRSR